MPDDAGIRSLFTDDEFKELVSRVRTELLPGLSDVRHNWQSNHSLRDRPEEHMQPLLDLFASLKRECGDDKDAVEVIDRELSAANEWIDENAPEEPERAPRQLEKVAQQERPQSARSIFDDVDACDELEAESRPTWSDMENLPK